MKIKFFFNVLNLLLSLTSTDAKSANGVIDVGVTAIIHPLCPVTPGVMDSIVVVITNFGNITITTVPIGVDISATPLMTTTWNGSLPPMSSDTFVLPVMVIFPLGQFTLCSYTIANDANGSNDTTCVLCSSTPMSAFNPADNSQDKLNVFPNPSQGNFSIKTENIHFYNSSIRITNILGKEVWKSNILKPEFNVDFTGEPNGVYVISLISPSAITNSKLILNK